MNSSHRNRVTWMNYAERLVRLLARLAALVEVIPPDV